MRLNMRRTAFLFLFFSLVFSLSACSNDNSENPMDSYRLANVGDSIKFGTYEQNDKESDGFESIEWQVLEREGNKLMIISKNILAYKNYNVIEETTTWEDCTLRLWLNEIFYKEAFSLEEQRLIMPKSVKMDANPYYDTDFGNDTMDKVYILSASEAERYFDSDAERIAKNTKTVTAYLSKKFYGSEEHSWWLRTLAADAGDTTMLFSDGSASIKNCAVFVDDDGIIRYTDSFNGDVINYFGVRPVLWIDLDADSQSQRLEIDRDTDALRSVANKLAAGDSFELGAYIQNDWSNGSEPIEWIVLDNQGNRILAVSRYALDCQPYSNTERANWSNCTLRAWLHDDFYNTAFSLSERNLLAREDETRGSVFLLTQNDVEQYLKSSDMLACSVTKYALAAGAQIKRNDIGDYNEENGNNCIWWLETSNGGGADAIHYDGSFSPSFMANCEWIAVRPAIWLKLE